MNRSIINSIFEVETRVLLLLQSVRKKPFTAERIVTMDFIVCYAESFQLPFLNLQGDNKNRFSELASRHMRIHSAIKDLVTRGLLDVSVNNGYLFTISEMGSKYIRKLKSDYATRYREIAAAANKLYRDYSDDDLERLIQDATLRSIKGGR